MRVAALRIMAVVTLSGVSSRVEAASICGTVVDASSQSPVKDALVRLAQRGQRLTNQNGEYSFDLPADEVGRPVEISVSKEGWNSQQLLRVTIAASCNESPNDIALRRVQQRITPPPFELFVDLLSVPESSSTASRGDRLEYRAEQRQGILSVRPALKYLETIDKGGPIEPLQYWGHEGPFDFQLPRLAVSFVNHTKHTVLVTQVVVEVDESHEDLTPVPAVRGKTGVPL